MKFHVVYETGPISYFGSNVDFWDFTSYQPKWLMQHPNTNIVTWQLNDLPLTQKWVNVYREKMLRLYELKRSKKPPRWRFVYDIYTTPTVQSVIESRRLMNTLIDELNSIPFLNNSFSNEYKLDVSDIENLELFKLNRLHEIFETEMVRITNLVASKQLTLSIEEWDNVWLKLQTVNMIVHYNENLTNNRGTVREFIESLKPAYFTALKWEEPHNSYVALDNEDYKHFTLVEEPGTLWLDFATVGKDLFHCFCTNDKELVESRMVSPQEELKPWVSYSWKSVSKETAEKTLNEFNNWLNINYYDSLLNVSSEPKYTPGRHPLGKCISHNFKNDNEFKEAIVAKTPKIRCFFLTNDDDSSIF